MNTQLECFFAEAKKWKEEFHLMRQIVSDNPLLEENYKWMHPCYTFEGKNVVLIHGFRDYCALLFHKGALLNDNKGILIQQTENVQSARQIRFTNTEQITELEQDIKDYIKQAIEIEKSGKKIELKKVSEYPIPAEFQKAIDCDDALCKAFYSLTPGRQKAYLHYFNQAKQSQTRESRIEKYYSKIIAGKGMDD